MGNEPLEPIPLTEENIAMARKLISEERAIAEMPAEVCTIDGECGA